MVGLLCFCVIKKTSRTLICKYLPKTSTNQTLRCSSRWISRRRVLLASSIRSILRMIESVSLLKFEHETAAYLMHWFVRTSTWSETTCNNDILSSVNLWFWQQTQFLQTRNQATEDSRRILAYQDCCQQKQNVQNIWR